MRKLIRYLQITCSTVCGLICLLLVALWVRSYSWVDAVPVAPSRYIGAMQGEIHLDCELSYPPDAATSNHRLGPLDILSVSNRDHRVRAWIHLSTIPTWSVILFFAGVAAVPWIRWRISWSVACVLVAIAFVANWIEMYNDSWQHKFRIASSTVLTIDGYRGRLAIGVWDASGQWPSNILWEIHRGPNADQPTGVPLGFRFFGSSVGNGVAAVIPYWFLILLATSAAVAPWLRWRKRFSLRTLFILMTLVAVLLAAVMYAVG